MRAPACPATVSTGPGGRHGSAARAGCRPLSRRRLVHQAMPTPWPPPLALPAPTRPAGSLGLCENCQEDFRTCQRCSDMLGALPYPQYMHTGGKPLCRWAVQVATPRFVQPALGLEVGGLLRLEGACHVPLLWGCWFSTPFQPVPPSAMQGVPHPGLLRLRAGRHHLRALRRRLWQAGGRLRQGGWGLV